MKKIVSVFLLVLLVMLLCSCSTETEDDNITFLEYKNEVTYVEFINEFENLIENSFLTNLKQYDFYFKMTKLSKIIYKVEDSDEIFIEEKSRTLETQHDFDNQIIRQISVDPEYAKKTYDITLFSDNGKYYDKRKDAELNEMEESEYINIYNRFINEVLIEMYLGQSYGISGCLCYIDDNVYTITFTQPNFSKFIHQYVINEKSLTLYYLSDHFDPPYNNINHSEVITTYKVELMSIDLKKDLN